MFISKKKMPKASSVSTTSLTSCCRELRIRSEMDITFRLAHLSVGPGEKLQAHPESSPNSQESLTVPKILLLSARVELASTQSTQDPQGSYRLEPKSVGTTQIGSFKNLCKRDSAQSGAGFQEQIKLGVAPGNK